MSRETIDNYDALTAIETVIPIYRKQAQAMLAKAMEHARQAVESGNLDHVKQARRLRASAEWMNRKAMDKERRLEALRSGQPIKRDNPSKDEGAGKCQ